MYASPVTKLIVGIFALLGIAALAILTLRLGQVEILPKPSYVLIANFDNVSGLKASDRVQIAGVDVGKITAIALHDDRARVRMRINQGIEIDDEAIASIKTAGIIGDKYIAIALGPSDKALADGGVIRHTQSAFVLEDAIGQLINSSGSGASPAQAKSGAAAAAASPAPVAAPSALPGASPSIGPPSGVSFNFGFQEKGNS